MVTEEKPTKELDVGAGARPPIPRITLSVEEAMMMAEVCRSVTSPDGAKKILIGQAQVSIERQLRDMGIEVHEHGSPPPAPNRAARRGR